MPTKATLTNPSDALPVGRHDAPVAAAAADIVLALVKCTRLSAPSAARTLKYRSFPVVTGLYTAAIASASSAPAVAAGHIDTRGECYGC